MNLDPKMVGSTVLGDAEPLEVGLHWREWLLRMGHETYNLALLLFPSLVLVLLKWSPRYMLLLSQKCLLFIASLP